MLLNCDIRQIVIHMNKNNGRTQEQTRNKKNVNIQITKRIKT